MISIIQKILKLMKISKHKEMNVQNTDIQFREKETNT